MLIQKMLRTLRISWIRFICRNSEWKNYTPAQKELFRNLKPGDIVDAWMPLPESGLLQIEESHRHRPYYVVRITEDAVIAYKGSSRKNACRKDMRVFISSNEYNVWKNGFVCLDQLSVLPVNCLISKLDTLKEHTMAEINRKILIQNHNGRLKQAQLFPAPAGYRAGDVFRTDRGLYYISHIDEHIHAHPLKAATPGSKPDLSRIDAERTELFRTDIPFTAVMTCRTPLIKNMSGSAEKRTNTHHSVQSMAKGHYYRYSVGQCLEQKWSQQRFIYLFSRRGNDYGIFESSIFADSMPVQKADSAFFSETAELADDDTVSYILNRLIDGNRRQWGWLEELMTAA
ncbi:MAG: type II toxin-antitoxin system PemK/MazF family toxin [Solobacterium sp.]|nr:type II toxin-antitoxin system PemK/MazF family toxin [Solobacterium sp.]